MRLDFVGLTHQQICILRDRSRTIQDQSGYARHKIFESTNHSYFRLRRRSNAKHTQIYEKPRNLSVLS